MKPVSTVKGTAVFLFEGGMVSEMDCEIKQEYGLRSNLPNKVLHPSALFPSGNRLSAGIYGNSVRYSQRKMN
jgi:hypothetical protein